MGGGFLTKIQGVWGRLGDSTALLGQIPRAWVGGPPGKPRTTPCFQMFVFCVFGLGSAAAVAAVAAVACFRRRLCCAS